MFGYQYMGYWIVLTTTPFDYGGWNIHQEPDDARPINGAPFETAFACQHFVEQQNRIRIKESPNYGR